jgi:hypothetical protein
MKAEIIVIMPTTILQPTKDLDARWANGPIRPDQLVEEIYADLKRTILP